MSITGQHQMKLFLNSLLPREKLSLAYNSQSKIRKIDLKPAQHCNISGHSTSGGHITLRPDHCYITFNAYSAVICIGSNPERKSFNYPEKMIEQFYKQQSNYVRSMIYVLHNGKKIGYLYLFNRHQISTIVIFVQQALLKNTAQQQE